MKGQEVRIILDDDNLNFKQPYKLCEMKRPLGKTLNNKFVGG